MKHILPRLLMALCALMLSVSSLWADRVSQEDAALVAANFFNAPDTTQGDTTQAVQAARRSRKVRRVALADEAQYYVYANADGEGWVMVAANDVARPIIAYSDEGEFRTDNQPANIKSWLGKYNRQIKQAEADGVQATDEVKQAWKQLRKGAGVRKGTPVVAALIKTKWDQEAPYYNQCPQIDGIHCLTGCVATAMAQVMNYWQWPETGTGSASVTVNNTKYTVDFTTGNYDWNNMLQKYKGYYPEGSSNWTTSGVSSGTTDQKNAVAKLMYHCGVAAEMDYGTNVSGAYTIYPNKTSTSTRCAQYALIQNFGYNSSTIKGYYRPGGYGYSSVNDATWHSYLKTELDAARPIMYAGSDNEGGHSFICDGYDNTTPTRKYHFNWGWSGYCDGYYDVDNLVPGTGGSGSGNGSYNDGQDIIIGIMPPETGHLVVLKGTGCTLSADTRVKNGNSLTVSITPADATYDYSSVSVMLGSTTISSSNYSLTNNNMTLTIDGTAITGADSNDLTITVVWTKNRYKYEMLGENCTEELSGMLAKNAALSLTITPDAGYTLANAECWDVTMGGNKLTYGTGFTYSGTTFSITKVTGDVDILAYGGHQVSWYANGSKYTTNMSINDKITLPANNPADCSGSDGKKFVGWCTISDYSDATTSPIFAKDGDDYTMATYYAVYATPAGSSAPRRAKMAESSAAYTFTSKSWAATSNGSAANWTSGKDGSAYDNNNGGVQVTAGASGANATCPTSYSNITSIVVRYCTNKNTGAGTIVMSVGSTEVSQSVTASGGTTARDLTFDFSSTKPSGSPKITVNCTTNSIYACGVTINYGGSGASYTDYSTACGTPCSNTPTMSFDNEVVSKTTADDSYTQTVKIDGKGSGQTVTYTSSNTTVATVNNSGVVTLKGVVGSTTITASVAADGGYCAASASYTLNVTAAPIDVTLYYSGTSEPLTNQKNPYTLPTTGKYVANMCDGDWRFDGWYGSTYTKSMQKPTYINQLTATGSAYAVYTTTETSGSGGSSTVDDELTATVFGITSTNYGNWSGKSVTSDAVYAGNSAKSSGGAIQLRSNNSNSGIVTTTSGGKARKVVVVWNSDETANDRKLDIYGKSSAYSAATDLYSNTNQGTKIGSIVKGTSTELTITDDYDFIGMRSNSGALYVTSITVTWETSSGGDASTTYYATTPECVTPCSHEPVMSFASATVNKTTDDKSYSQAVTIDGKGEDQTVTYSSSDETIATVDNSGAVTLLGKVGSTTITAAVDENGDYCAAYASYTITVTQAQCVLTGITLNTSNATTTFTTGAAFSSAGLVVTAKYSNCADAVVTPTSISSPDMTSAGTKEITVSYTENGAPQTATYTITVSDPVTYTVTWSVNGTATSVTYNEGQALTLPSTPSDCSGEGGRKFVGWTANSSVSGSAPADLFTEASGTVTANATYYAVYAAVSAGGGGGGTTDITLNPAKDQSFPKDGIALSVSDGTLTNGTDYRVYKGHTLTITSSVGNMTNIALTYSSASYDGGSWASSYTPNAATWTSPTTSGEQARITQIIVTVSGGSGTTYSDYSLTCTVAPPATTYTVTWVVCGDVYKTDTFNEGAALVLPATPGANAGKAFVGWTAMEHYTGASAPPDLFSTAGSKTVTGNVTYYAVYE